MKSSVQSTDAIGIQIASEATAEIRGKPSLMHSCRFKGEGTGLGGNCIYKPFFV